LKTEVDKLIVAYQTAPAGDAQQSNLYSALSTISFEFQKFLMDTYQADIDWMVIYREVPYKCE
jgi:hypothetical protein